ncbi:efflux RND transporter periplasmic adaptor subunit [Lutibacter sp. TH_r2]|uniref:efflux RND transporter periplasmic adaptor subunit n=1 Tax=Lutibacter sp. TH_r2 TaxID=3082083 RepID=UPI0029550212|nr:efflux RND transporter periplasmic adaptor subunit [Lutibacter sp. TH_r2]MDV7186191.1 efflux RND transporter periplasmic adaptor subunit [Lutibacter sp. TH_r2]
MKTKLNILLITLTVILSSCGSGENTKIDANKIESLIEKQDLGGLKSAKATVTSEYSELRTQLDRINAALSKLDTVTKAFDVTAIEIKDTLFTHFVEFQGNVKTKQNVVILSEYNGTLSKIYVKEGQSVSKGQILAKIDDGGLSQQVAQLQAQADLAETTFQRQKKLWEQKIGSEIQFLQAKTSATSAQNALNQLKSQLAKTTVRAPFSGTIDNIITDQGSVVQGGTALFRIVNLNSMYVEAEVPEKYITSVKKGTNAEVHLPMLNETIKSNVRQVSNFINPNNRSFTIEVSIPNKNGNIKPNLTSKVSINDYNNANAILVPQSVISENAEGEEYVYAAIEEDGKTRARRVIIETEKSQNGFIEITKGLSVGTHLIVEGARSVKDGQLINIK